MEPFLGAWRLDREFDENVEEFAEAEGIPLMIRKSVGRLEVIMVMKTIDDGMFDCQIKLGVSFNHAHKIIRKKKMFVYNCTKEEINL